MVEIVIVITILGVLAALLIPAFRDLIPSSKVSTAQANLEILNQSVLKYNQANIELVMTAGGGNETNIAQKLQTRDPAAPGSPFLDANFQIVMTDDLSTYRAVWDGRMYEMVSTGTAASGIDLLLLNSRSTP